MLNVHAGDIVWQKEHLIAVELLAIFRLECRLVNLLHQPHDEVPGANERIDDIHPAIRKRPVEFGFQDMRDAFHDEIDNRLRRIDDAVRIRNLDREALEKLLIHRIDEVLFLREIDERRGGAFNRGIERLEAFEELGAVPLL